MLLAISLRSILSANVMAWLLLGMIFISIISTVFIRPADFPRSRLNVFFSVLASITVLFIGLSLLISAFTFEKQESTNRTAVTKESIDKLWLYPNQLLSTSTRARPIFLKSFYPNNLQLYNTAAADGPASISSILEEQNIAIVFIQAWEDFLTLRNLDKTGDAVWLNNFIQWAQSPYLKEYFDFLKYNFKATTIELGNLLFEYAKSLPLPTEDPELYRSTILKMLSDERLIALFERVSLENQ